MKFPVQRSVDFELMYPLPRDFLQLSFLLLAEGGEIGGIVRHCIQLKNMNDHNGDY
jgi:hypothetical protein